MATAKPSEESCDQDFENESSGPCVGQRHWVVLMISWLICGIFCMRDVISVAIVAMVNNTAEIVPSQNKNTSDCPTAWTNETSNVRFNDGTFLWPRDLQGVILGSLFWGFIVLQVPGGALSQRFGAKWILGVSTLANVILTALSPISAYTSPYLLVAVRVVEGLFQGVTFSASQAMLSRWVPPREAGFLNTIAFSGSSIGAMLSLAISGFLCRELGWESSFYVAAGVGVLTFLPWAVFVTNSPEENPRISAEELAYITRHLGRGQQENYNRMGVPWFRIFTDTAVWANIVINFCSVWVYNIIISCMPQFLSDVQHVSISMDGTLAAIPWIVNFLFSVIMGYVSDLLVEKSYLRPITARKSGVLGGCVATSICLCGVAFFACNKVVSVSLIMLVSGFLGAAMTPQVANVSEISPEFSGVVVGIVTAVGAITGFVAPQVTDHLTKHGTVMEWNLVFFIASGISLFGALFFLIFASSERRNWVVSTEDRQPLIIQEEGHEE